MIIAVTSVLGALAAFHASVLATDAEIQDGHAFQELIAAQARRLRWEGEVAHDLRLLTRYQEHLWSWRRLRADTDRARAENPQLAASLDAQAQGELAVAYVLRPYFLATLPDFGDAGGSVEYDREFALESLIVRDSTLRDLRPEAIQALAERVRTKASFLVGIVALFVTALFFLTLALLAHVRTRRILAQLGGSVIVAALVLWGVVQVLYP